MKNASDGLKIIQTLVALPAFRVEICGAVQTDLSFD
jgi:hypothetical protein